jgi:outer membrane protein TolC
VTRIGLVVVCGLAVGARADEALQIDEAVRLAETRNERGRIADLNIDVSAASVEKARTAFLPVLNANNTDVLRPWSPPSTATLNVTLNQPLLDAAAIPLYRQARANLAAQVAQSTDDRRQLAFDAARAFFNVLLAEEVVASAEEKLATAQANLALTEDELKQKLIGANDVTRAQIDEASSERELASDRGAVDSARVILAFTIDSPVPASVTSPDALLAAGRQAVSGVDRLVSVALVRRPDYAAKREAAVGAHDLAEEPLLRLIPTINLSGTFSLTSLPGKTGNIADQTIGLAVSWPIYDAGSRYADAHGRAASATIADLNADLLARTVDEQVRSAAALLASAQAALKSAETARDASRLSATETEELYRRGLAKAIELVDANEQRFLAEVNFATAEFNVATAYLALRQAIGLEPIGTELP